MPEYDNLADLRQALSADDPDSRAEAYGAVMQHDVEPSQLLQTPPDDGAVETLRSADVLAQPGEEDRSAADQRQEILEKLNEIADHLGGSN